MKWFMKLSREKLFNILGVAFGIVWGIDAAFKWTPAFLNGLPDMISSMISGQPVIAADWLGLWVSIFNTAPHFFAVCVAIVESALAIGLILNLFPRIIYIGGFSFSLLLWSVGEAFGGPYSAGSTDIGCAIIYAFVFAALYFQRFGKTADCTIEDGKVETGKLAVKDVAIKSLALTVVVLLAILVSPYLIIRNNSAPSADMNDSSSSGMSPDMMQKTFELASTTLSGGIIAPIPTISFTLTKDTLDGWDLYVSTTNFIWTPQNINQAPIVDQGHVHLYIDGNLIVLLAPWYHIDSSKMPPGTHNIIVTLNANDHSVFSYKGKYIQATSTVTVGEI